ncbi:MAG: Phosphoesterase RecJ domain protein [Candidatus Woesebacteria bacterium GW2011_GWB1_41_10]|uniref:Phosphoesterase RecJ domain protein n=1 Tax=Candidatus Woesebacteria bacterium GW2011_GWB1_41_10 TaxID=1618577 RepID=A0A0G0UBU7_9BACT|nr:MAG: Phosphoesterase RecJ domain protein [Candidatus Woesebacteria bacterium GW2011_GWB1_41_10]
MNESFSSLIDSASSILILLPNKPYFDQVAAGLSLYLSLRDKKSTAVSCPSPMTVGFNRLIGVNKISSELGSKNLLITFPNYDAGNIEKVSYDIENGEFKLTVVPKDGFNAPQKEQIGVNHSGISADLIILIGGANESHFPALSQKDFEGARIAHIGTRTLTSERGVMSFARPGSSVSELIASLIKENELPMDVDTATNLVMGIEDGSSNFTSSEVIPETFEMFAHLLRSGGQRQPKVKLSPVSFPQAEPVTEQIENKEEMVENPPSDWLQPKVYKGTSVS